MKKTELFARLPAFLKKYRYLLLLVLAGVVLLLLPGGKNESEETRAQSADASQSDRQYVDALEQRLSALLAKIDGAGQVNVLLTLQSGSRTVYQSDVSAQTDDGKSSREEKTVILSKGSAYDEAAIAAVYYPKFQGALIVCQGADHAVVRLAVINAVAALTGLSADKITVVKMK